MNDEETPNSDKDTNQDYDEFFGVEPRDHRKRLTKAQQAIAWRRHKIFQMMVTGVTNTYQLSAAMHISQSTCFRDQQWLKAQATKELQTHIADRLP